MTMEAALPFRATEARGPATLSDSELVLRTQRGDAEAFSVLVERYQHLVYSLAYRFMHDATQAEDLAQEAFLKAFRQLKGFRGECSFSTWLYRVTASVCLSELDRRKRRQEVALLPAHERVETAQPGDTLDFSELIRRCVAKLSPRYAKVITLYYLRETSYEEIASRLHIPSGTLKTWMHRARKQLKTIVEEELGSHDAPHTS